MMKRLLTLLLLLISCYTIAQTNINMLPGTTASPTRYTGCATSAFNDDGGNINYSDNFTGVAIFCPIITTDRMILDFLVMDIAVNDVLTIYDGDSTAAPLLATITNTNVPPGAFQASATNPTGCLTVQFISDGSGNASGWRAARSCFDPCQTITTNIVTTPAIDPDGILRVCQGDTVTFDGSASFSNDGTGATYEWDLANGGMFNSGQVQTETYATTGIYQTKFRVTDSTGCTDREEIDLVVQVSSDPDFTGTMAADTQICFGDSTTLTGVATPQEFLIPVSPPVTGRTFLPDGSGVSYTTCINVDLFGPGAVVASASDIVDIFVNMEHSYLGDLQLTITAPNGSSVDLHQYPSGGGTFLGVPIDVDTDRNPGTGFDYVFTETAAQTWSQAANGNSTIPAGDYLPVDPYSSFIGSPLNGQWCISITDNLFSDNGYIFFWGLNFNPAIIPSDLSFTPVVVSEQWQSNPDITSTVGNTITVTPSIEGQNCYTYEMTDNHGCTYTEQVCIDVSPEILSASPNDIVECNTTGAPITVDLTVNDPIILNGLQAVDHTITYHNSQSDAENGVNAITNATAFPVTMPPVTVFSAITNATTNCKVVDSFIVDIIDLTMLNIPDYDQCGPIINFDLDAYVAQFLSSGGSGGANFTISYYTNLTDAQNGTNPIVNPNMFNLPVGTVTIYVRIVSNSDSSCNSIAPFSLTAGAVPTASPAMDMVTCDDLSNDGQEVFVLSSQDAIILNGQAATVTYHLNPLDAANGAAPLNASGYQNISNPQTIYARVTDNTSLMCSDTTSFELIVNRRAAFINANDIITCDDGNDGIEQFDLTQNTIDILGTQSTADNTITFYTSQANADGRINEIVLPASYNASSSTGTETIYVRIENNSSTDCYDTGSFDIIMSDTPIANPIADVVLCDDVSNDGINDFILADNSPQILQSQDPLIFTVSYYATQADADAESNPLSSTLYTNTLPQETIFVRIENNNNPDCFETTSFDLIINESPRITSAPDLTLCDDPSGDGAESFDLSQNDAIILNGLNPADYTITYSNTAGSITTPYINNGNPETITVTVQNNLTTCSDFTTFDLIVSPVPNVIPTFTIEECDEDGDGVAIFTFSDAVSQIVNGQSDVEVTFHDSQANANAGTNDLDETAYSNTGANQTIYYRLEFNSSGCYSLGEFIIEPVDAPIAIIPTPLEGCDDGSGNATVNVNDANTDVTTGQIGSTVVYYLTQTDADSQSNGITDNFTFSSSTTLIVRVDDDNTDCFSFTTLDLIFNPLPSPSLLNQYVLCKDENGNLVNGAVTLDTGLNDVDFNFEWTMDGAPIAATTASIDVIDGGDYEVNVTRISTGCEITDSTNVRVSSVPDIYDIDITTDPFDKDHQVIVTAEGPDQYWFRLDDGPYVNSGIFNNVSPGPHTVTIAERSGCGEIVVEIFVFGYPDYFTPNADGIHDTWNIIGGDLLPGTNLYIFDRHGKLIKQLAVDGAGWDGTYNGQPMPSSDYWFKIEYAFDGQQREASGHFAMKR